MVKTPPISQIFLYAIYTGLYIHSMVFHGSIIGLLTVTIIILLYWLYEYRQNKVLSVIIIYMSTYFFYMIPYLFYDISFATRMTYQSFELTIISIKDITLFTNLFLLFLFYTLENHKIKLKSKVIKRDNVLVYAICLIVLFFFSILTMQGPTILTGVYKTDTALERYGFIDYAVFFVIIAYLFSNTRRKDLLLLLATVLYMTITLLYGYRMRVLQMGFLLFIIYFENIKTYKVYLIAFLGFVFMSVFSVYRSKGNFGLYEMMGLKDSGVIVSNQGGVLLTSNMYLGLLEDNVIDTSIRVKTFIGNLFSIFISQNALPSEYVLSKFTAQFFQIPGGGFISSYLHIWLGPIGILIGAYIIAKIVSVPFKNKITNILMVYSITILVTTPRWYAYNPINFFKMGIWAMLVYICFLILHNTLLKIGGIKKGWGKDVR
ncbi:hypothetical protein [Pseudalkalibacillus sp. JSM 102089]|uniref:hypothetical protein n=1 Tax=Pseudalkalibacillus sp. JSM 102089 TaxID=3229856 RepID=UPI0035259FFF